METLTFVHLLKYVRLLESKVIGGQLIEGQRGVPRVWVGINHEEMKQRRHLMNECALLNHLWVPDPPPHLWSMGQTPPQEAKTGPVCLINQLIPTPVHWRRHQPLQTCQPPAPKLLTFVLRLRAGDDPLDQAALHEGLSREARLLPLPRILHPSGCGLHAVGISQQAVDHLAIRLEREKESKRGGELGSACEFKDGSGS